MELPEHPSEHVRDLAQGGHPGQGHLHGYEEVLGAPGGGVDVGQRGVDRRLIAFGPHPPDPGHLRLLQLESVSPGDRLRIQATRPFMLHWSRDEWRHFNDTGSNSTPIGFDYVDIDIGAGDRAPVRFTFNWRETHNWEGRDYAVAIAK